MSETPLGEPAAPAAYPPGWWVPDATEDPSVRRPNTILAAAIITWAASLITVLGMASLVVFTVSAGEPILDSFDGSRAWVYSLGAGTMVWSAAACLLARWAMAGHNWARISLAGSAAGTVAVSISMFWLGIPFISLFAAIAVLVLLFVGGANDWYRLQKAQRMTP